MFKRGSIFGLRWLIFPALLATTFLVYVPGLSGPFLFDDEINVVNNSYLKIDQISLDNLKTAAYSVPNGPLGRPISMASFALNYYFEQDVISPFPVAYGFKLTNLVIHLLCGIAVYLFTRQLLVLYRERRTQEFSSAHTEWVALAVSAAWLLHPLNLTSVLYVVQRMASLAALFVFLGLTLYLFGRRRMLYAGRGGKLAILTSLTVFTPLAMLCKENGLLTPFLILAAELTLFRFEAARLFDKRWLISVILICTVLPAIAAIGYLTQHPDFLLAGYAKRDFTLTERLLTEARVIWFYLRLIVIPSTPLMGIYHDDIAISRSLFEPASTLSAILGIVALMAAIFALRRRLPIIAFGILFFLIGHGMESTVYPLELVHEHRNYLPIYGVLLAVFYLLLAPFQNESARIPRRMAAVIMIGLFAVVTFLRSNAWSNSYALWTTEVEHHPASTRSNNDLANLYASSLTFDPVAKESNYKAAKYYYERVTSLQPENTTGLFGMLYLSEHYDRPVDSLLLTELASRLERGAIPANTNDHLKTLSICAMKPACPVGSEKIEALINAALRNPKVLGRDKALIYSALTFYLVNVKHDYNAAIAATNSAIALDPGELNHRLLLVKCLIELHRNDEAVEQINLIKQLDTGGLLKGDIAQMEEQLS